MSFVKRTACPSRAVATLRTELQEAAGTYSTRDRTLSVFSGVAAPPRKPLASPPSGPDGGGRAAPRARAGNRLSDPSAFRSGRFSGREWFSACVGVVLPGRLLLFFSLTFFLRPFCSSSSPLTIHLYLFFFLLHCFLSFPS